MIKKFKEYIKESVDKSELVECLSEILPITEVEDQFLRLEEVFDCEIQIMEVIANNRNIVYIKRYSIDIKYTSSNRPEIIKELKQIKYRLESMSNKINVDMSNLYHIKITLKDEFDYWQSF